MKQKENEKLDKFQKHDKRIKIFIAYISDERIHNQWSRLAATQRPLQNDDELEIRERIETMPKKERL